MSINLTGLSLSIDNVIRVAREHERVSISKDARKNLDTSREFVEKSTKSGKVIYGITTGFGSFKNIIINQNQVEELQRNLIMSHAIGAGPAMAEDWVRAAILIRINSLLRGYSGIRYETVQALVDLLNFDIYPYVPAQGSVGSSGDLAPLSHIMLVIMGMGEVLKDGARYPSVDILKKNNLTPVILQAKEGLALNNGTAVQTGIGCLALADAMHLAKLADISLAMSLESMMGSVRAFDDRIHKLRPHKGQIDTAKNIRQLCANSKIIESHKNCGRVQDAYSLRCSPQVHGACKDGLDFVRKTLEIEINSVTDNPLIFSEDDDVI
ncbi:MAG: aromatic amino acid ammonia-lyase, partial [Pseudomonadota bacterium]